jgi:hypothetical protein
MKKGTCTGTGLWWLAANRKLKKGNQKSMSKDRGCLRQILPLNLQPLSLPWNWPAKCPEKDPALLKQELTENADGALKDYMQELNLEAEGISTTSEFIKLLEEKAEPEGFSMEDVSQAMLESLGMGAEDEDVSALVAQWGLEAGGALKDELESLDLEREGITSHRELFEYLYEQAGPSSYPKNEVDAMLSDVLSHGDVELLRQLLVENKREH